MILSDAISLDREGGRSRNVAGERRRAGRDRGRDKTTERREHAFRLHTPAGAPSLAERNTGGKQARASAVGPQGPPGPSASAHEVVTGRGGDGGHFVSFRMEARGKGTVWIEIVERNGAACLKVTTESEAARAWIVERSGDIQGVLVKCGLTLAGLDVQCRGRQDRAVGRQGKRAPAARCASAPPGLPGPAFSRGELIG
jgi:hypothetical protein